MIELADDGSLARGTDYARRGRVHVVSSSPRHVTAEVRGSTTYDVTLESRDWSCTCPVGVTGAFCKHLVATALAASEADSEPELDAPGGPDPLEELAGWLAGLDRDGLRSVLEELDTHQPDAVDELDRLRARAAGDLSALRPLVDGLRTRRFLDWRAADRHGQSAYQVADELKAALSPTTAAELLPLVERAIGHLLKVISRSDDSSGIQGGATRELFDLHAEAARMAAPPTRSLVRWLVAQTFDENCFIEIDVVRYADALGDTGLATYRREIEKGLEKSPEHWSGQRALQRLAVLSGDAAEIVRLVGGPLENTFRYVALVNALLEAGLEDEALEYALAGTTTSTSPQQTPVLYDTAVRLLTERGELDRALGLRRQQLQELTTESSYAALKSAAEQLDVWPTERLAALDVLLERSPRAWLSVLLDGGETDLAWDASRDMTLDPAMVLRLARERAKTHPADVWDVYVPLVDDLLRKAHQQNYRQAVAHLGELRRACAAAGQEDRYASLVGELLERHRRRPTLVAMLMRLPR